MGCRLSLPATDSSLQKNLANKQGGDVIYPFAQYLRPDELDYEIGDCYFKGFHQLVHARHAPSNAGLCLKTYPAHQVAAFDMIREITILSHLSQGCPAQFPAYKGIFVHNHVPHIVMSRHHATSLSEVVEELNAVEKLQVWNAIVDAVMHCHRYEVIVCALHPDFIKVRVTGKEDRRKIGYLCYLIRTFEVQLTEFGGSVVMYEKLSSTDLQQRAVWPNLYRHCHPFIAPELGLVDDGNTFVTEQADVWSMGVLLHFMMFAADPLALLSTRKSPGRDPDSSRYCDVIRDIEQHSPSVCGYRSLVTKMVELFPEERPALSCATKPATSNVFLEVEKYFRDPTCFSNNKRFMTGYK